MPRKKSVSALFKEAEQLAHKKFGFEQLSQGQLDALCALLGGHDTLAILPTGGGKSAIYQLAGLVHGGLTIVVSPLIALQCDQMEHLRVLQIEAHVLNSSLSATEREQVWEALGNSKSAFLLLAPEQFANQETLGRLQALKPKLFVVDEAHCISSWGHDFRPDYGRLNAVIEALERPQVLALTATAAPPVRSEILSRLGIEKAEVIVAGFDRPNLRLEVRDFFECEQKQGALLRAVLEGPTPAIIYCATRSETEEVAEELNQHGHQALAYHAGLSKKEREERQSQFMNGEAEVFVATVAFGMGVDKPNVRRVYHLDVSESLDSYYQEAGRAGRDGEGAEAVLFFCDGDLGLRRSQIGSGKASIQTAIQLAAVLKDMKATRIEDVEKELEMSHATLMRTLTQLEEAGALSVDASGAIELRKRLDLRMLKRELQRLEDQAHDWDKSRLEMMRQYAQTRDCRRQFLLGYFGEQMERPCGKCDNCERNRGEKVNAQGQETHDDFKVGMHVVHKEWGGGEITRQDADSLVVIFESVGYKTLLRELVVEHDLLRPGK